MLLSACLIVKNEELTIHKCLSSLQDVVDEIIVVDTGSTDRTMEIAKEFGASIYQYEWDGDFSNARNESLRHANGDYILVIDADEYLDQVERVHLRDFLYKTDADGIFIRLRNYVGSLHRFSVSPDILLLRIFRRGYMYSGYVHEQIYQSIKKNNGKATEFQLTFHHMGYLKEFISSRKKVDRNLELVKKEVELNPEGVFHNSNLMAEYLRGGNYSACIEIGEKLLKRLRIDKDKLNRNEQDEGIHLYVRSLIYLIVGLGNAGDRNRALEVAAEAAQLFPGVVEIQKRFSDALIASGEYTKAISVLMKCRKLGEPAIAFFDTFSGLGSYLASADLGMAWAMLGDDIQAKKWFLTSFVESPSFVNFILSLVHLLPDDAVFLERNVENKINDCLTYETYIEAYALKNIEGTDKIVQRYQDKFGVAHIGRDRMILALRQGSEDMKNIVQSSGLELDKLLYGIYLLNKMNENDAEKELHSAGELGKYVLEVHRGIQNDENYSFQIAPILRDLIAMKAEYLLSSWIRHASDRNDVWLHIKYSPLAHLLQSIEWNGDSYWECEYNAMRFFRNRQWEQSSYWLEKAMETSPTVTKVLIECDLALAHQNVEHVRGVLKNAKEYFNDSEVIKNVIQHLKIFNESNKLSFNMQEITISGIGDLVNPMDVYRKNSVQTMPLNVQLSQLHERGALITQLIRELSDAGKVNDMRKYIEELQNILTFLRSSLDRRLEISQITDQTYLFMYKTTVKWYLQPNCVADEYEIMIDFWQSWAETWKKVQSK